MIIILLTLYSCKNRNDIRVGDERDGGYVYYVNDWQYKIVRKVPFGLMTYSQAEKISEDFFEGHRWWLPTHEELRLVYQNIYLKSIGEIPGREYWSADWFNYDENVYTIDFWKGDFKTDKNKNNSEAYFLGVAWKYLPKE